MTRDDIFEQDRNERNHYMECPLDEEVELPLTKDGFEALLERATSIYALPMDDAMKQVFAGYIHHIPNEQNTITIKLLAKVFYKSVANSTSWRIDQETKLKIREETDRKAKELAGDSQVIPINPEKH
jgi:hypothetical protein